jgi:uncharacterized protein YrzB (UPF0473 family)
MKKYKFYSLTDKDEDAIYIFDASNIEEAYVLASQIKKLPLEDFKKIFKVEEILKQIGSGI